MASVDNHSETHQFDNKFVSDKYFKEETIWDKKSQTTRKIKLAPGLPFKRVKGEKKNHERNKFLKQMRLIFLI